MKSGHSSFCAVVTFCAFAALAFAQSNFGVRHTNPSGGALRALATDGGLMVTAGDAGLILSSPDGQNWTKRTSATGETLRGAAFGAGQFVVVGDSGTILRSGNGSEWVPATSPGTHDHFYAVTYGRGRFVAVGDYGVVIYSTDGDRWTEGNRFVLTPLRAVLYGSGTFVATGDNGVVYGSYDGVIWSNRFSSTTKNLQAMGYGQNGFVAVGDLGAVQFGGSDAFSWGSFGYSTGTSVRLRGVSGGANVSTAVGDNGTVLVSRVTDTWTPRATGRSENFHAVGFAHDTFVVTGDHETILQSEPVFSHALRNISVRAEVGAGERALIGGFSIRGVAPKRLLIRGAGPSLANFGVGAPLANPVLTLYNATGAALFTNAGWSTSSDADALRSAAKQSGAYAYPEGSTDSALLVTLVPGIYTAVISARGGETGEALLECYDLDPAAESQSRLTNLSARAFVGAGDGAVLPGLSIAGSGRLLLLRAIGPGLTQFGVTGALKAMKFRIIYPGLVTSLIGGLSVTPPAPGRWYSNWNERLDYANAYTPEDTRETAAKTGAFPLIEQSRDAAGLLALGGSINPYSVEVRSADGSSGIALIEIYDVTDP